MRIEGSCHCEAVRFSVETNTPYPYQRCYCSICRKTQGGGGYAVNIMGWADSLKVEGAAHISVYHARTAEGESLLERRFCRDCGSALWVFHNKWPDLIHPFASAIDTPLPMPDEIVHMMTEFKAEWVELPEGDRHVVFPGHPNKSTEVWHERSTSAREKRSGNNARKGAIR